ncbi:DUF2851 family protein, partial [candidate division KSB3 bacterium]|nr:DUF2851 family protein [candidate division KSB3 bacterium]MBD3325211.1 DUF2851 family protein [candidate division KSB3 bacterium]
LFESYLQLFRLGIRHPDHMAQQISLLERTLTVPVTGYWKGRYGFGKPVFAAHDRMLLGQSRRRDILISAVFPVFWLYARTTSQPDLEAYLVRLYNRFPAPGWNRITSTVAAQVFAERGNIPAELHTASLSQGMLHLYKQGCALPACASCPLGV